MKKDNHHLLDWLRILILLLSAGTIRAQVWRDMQPQMKDNYSGLTTSLCVNPNRPSEVLAGTMGGLYQSMDEGNTWVRMVSFPAPVILDVAFCPNNPEIILVSTNATNVLAHRLGLYRSTNHGLTWSAVGNPYTVTNACPNRCAGKSISWVPGSNTVFVGTDCGLIKSTDNGLTWSQVSLGALSTTVPDGNNFYNIGSDQVLSVLAIDGSHIVVGRVNGNYFTADGINWSRSNSTFGADCVHSLCRMPQRPNVVFGAGWSSQGVHYSTDFGATWTPIPGNPMPAGNIGPFVRASMSGLGPQYFEIYYGDGTNLWKGTFKTDLSDLNTARFGKYQERWNSSTLRMTQEHVDFYDIVFSVNNIYPYLLAGDGGIQRWVKDDDRFKLVGGNKGGLNAIEVYGLGVHWSAQKIPQIHMISWHNSGRRSLDGGQTWKTWGNHESRIINVPESPLASPFECRVTMGEKTELWACDETGVMSLATPGPEDLHRHLIMFKHPATQKQWYLMATWNFQGNNVGYHVRPVESGNWTLVATSNFGPPYGAPFVGRRGNNVMMYHPVEKNGVIRLLVIDNILSPVQVTPRLPAMVNFGSIAMGQDGSIFDLPIACDPLNALNLIAADKMLRKVHRSTDGGESWRPLDGLTNLITDNNRILFTLQGNACQVTEIAFDRTNPNRIFLGTDDSGVFASFDAGNTWSSINPPTGKVMRVSELSVGPDGELYVGSLGMGLWKCTF